MKISPRLITLKNLSEEAREMGIGGKLSPEESIEMRFPCTKKECVETKKYSGKKDKKLENLKKDDFLFSTGNGKRQNNCCFRYGFKNNWGMVT